MLIPSYRFERYYDQLVDEMISNDLAIRARVEKVELLIFPSTMLPSQYKSKLHYIFYFMTYDHELNKLNYENKLGNLNCFYICYEPCS
jgi:hypothetical protein